MLVLACVSACTSTTSGSGQAASATPPGATFPGTTPASSPATTSPSTTGPSAGASATAVPKRRLTVTGTVTRTTYDVTIWDSDDITDCSTHAYGTAMIRFLGAHPCRGAHRVLATVSLGGRTVALSAVSTSFAGTPDDPYAATAEFIKLEQADGTGSINDLLREGGTLPGATAIPRSEAFSVQGQDAGVTVFDAWYLTGTTVDQDPKLTGLEEDLFLTDVTTA